MMKNHLLIGFLFTIFLSSCEKNLGRNDEKPIMQAIGKVNADSSAKPIVTPIVPSKIIDKSAYEVSKIPYSLSPQSGKEVVSVITASSGFSLKILSDIRGDEKGNLLLSNYRSPLIKFDGNSFKSYLKKNSDGSEMFIGTDKNGHQWFEQVILNDDKYIINKILIFNGISKVEVKGQIISKSRDKFNTRELIGQQGFKNRIWIVNNNEKTVNLYEGRELLVSYDSSDFPFRELSLIKEDRDGNVYFIDQKERKITLLKNGNFSLFTPVELEINERLFFFLTLRNPPRNQI